jgi:hypothetical protein
MNLPPFASCRNLAGNSLNGSFPSELLNCSTKLQVMWVSKKKEKMLFYYKSLNNFVNVGLLHGWTFDLRRTFFSSKNFRIQIISLNRVIKFVGVKFTKPSNLSWIKFKRIQALDWHCHWLFNILCRNCDRNAFSGALNMNVNTSALSGELSMVNNDISELIPSWESGIYSPVL